MNSALPAVLLLTLLGCSEVWIRPGTTLYQFSQDRSHCTKQSAVEGAPAPPKGKDPEVDQEKFNNCMNALGYKRGSKSSTVLY